MDSEVGSGAKDPEREEQRQVGEIEIGHKKDGTETPRKEAKMERRGGGGLGKSKRGKKRQRGETLR